MNNIYIVFGKKETTDEIVRVFKDKEQANEYCFNENLRVDNDEKMFYPHTYYFVDKYSII